MTVVTDGLGVVTRVREGGMCEDCRICVGVPDLSLIGLDSAAAAAGQTRTPVRRWVRAFAWPVWARRVLLRTGVHVLHEHVLAVARRRGAEAPRGVRNEMWSKIFKTQEAAASAVAYATFPMCMTCALCLWDFCLTESAPAVLTASARRRDRAEYFIRRRAPRIPMERGRV